VNTFSCVGNTPTVRREIIGGTRSSNSRTTSVSPSFSWEIHRVIGSPDDMVGAPAKGNSLSVIVSEVPVVANGSVRGDGAMSPPFSQDAIDYTEVTLSDFGAVGGRVTKKVVPSCSLEVSQTCPR